MKIEQKWRLILGKKAEPTPSEQNIELSQTMLGMDETLEALYDADDEQTKKRRFGREQPACE